MPIATPGSTSTGTVNEAANEAANEAINEVNQLQPRRGAGAAVIAGGRAARFRRDGRVIEIWDLGKKAIATTIPVPEPEFGWTSQGDAILVVVNDPAGKRARVVRLAAGSTTPTVLTGAALGASPDRVIATEHTLFVGENRWLYRFALGASLVPAGHITWPTDQIDTVTGLGDGVAFVESGAIVRLGAGDQRAAYTTSLPILHLAAGPSPEKVWATTASALHLLALAGSEAKSLREVALPGVYHLAASGPDVAVLSVETKAGAWSRFTLTVVGADGAVRWRKDLPVPRRVDASVAGGPGYVAVMADDQLRVFASKDGAAVLP